MVTVIEMVKFEISCYTYRRTFINLRGSLMPTQSKREILKQTILLVIFTALFICCVVVQAILKNVGQTLFTEENRFLLSCIIAGVASQVELLMAVLLTLKCEKRGYITSLVLSVASMAGVSVNVFVNHQAFDALGYACSIMSIIVTTILYRQLYLLDKNTDTLHRAVFEDDLTGLPNRKRVLSSLSNRTANTGTLTFFSLIFIDLDEFKVINDVLGHQVGDLFLKEVTHYLQSCIHQNDFLGRTGGDEFVVIVPGEHMETELYHYAQKMAEAISTPFVYRNKEIKITATFGITQYPKDGGNATELLQHADMAMYRGKAQGKGRIVFYDDEMQRSIEKRMNIETQLHSAIEHNEMYLVYQPQYDPTTHKLRGLETLARWDSPTLGHVPPMEFIPIAEENGDIIPMGKWIMERACTQYMEVYDSYETPPILSVNISAVQFRDPDFLDSIKRTIKKTNMDTDHLELEITESVCIMSPEISLNIFAEIKNMGISIAMDDFGTGYSSLSYLRTLPLNTVKIDTTFTRTILTTPTDQNLIKTIITMSHQLKLKVIAEGVEKPEQLEYLVKNGCDYIQGNLFGAPAPMKAW